MKQSKVSMVMPCYNKEKYIGEMFDSIIAQEWDNIELILVNDGSTDGTREIIAAYESRFRARGYEVVIVDQENAGVCAAAKAGLSRITGEYVCMVDADDELDPAYVSAMAGWLEGHPECDYCMCEGIEYTGSGAEKAFAEFNPRIVDETEKRPTDRYLLCDMRMTVWIYMLRSAYFHKCNILETYHADTRGSHEPGYIIPLLEFGGGHKQILRPLYRFNAGSDGHSRFRVYEQALNFYGEYGKLCYIAIDALPDSAADEGRKNRLKAEADFLRLSNLYAYSRTLAGAEGQTERVVSELISFANDCFNAPGVVTRSQIAGFESSFIKILKWALFGKTGIVFERSPGRIIGCGALGRAAAKLLPLLRCFALEPTELWDVDGDGVIVKKPAWDSLSSDDIVFLFPTGNTGKELRSAFAEFPCKVYDNEDICMLLARELAFGKEEGRNRRGRNGG
jgi:glycosyltransferase involved in cell wall biosynthesis